jgi:hypothetical protein
MRRIAMTFALAALCASSTLAQDDRENIDPATWTRKSLTPAGITTYINAGYRLSDLEIEATSTLTFSATLIQNSGSYRHSSWWWYHSLSSLDIAQKLQGKDARIVDLERYSHAGKTYYAMILVGNGGSAKMNWSYQLNLTGLGIISYANQNKMRPIDIEPYYVNNQKRYAAVFVDNTGSNFRKWYLRENIKAGTFQSVGQPLGCYPYNIESNSQGSFDVIYVEDPGNLRVLSVHGLNSQETDAFVRKWGKRPYEVETFYYQNERRYSILACENSDPALRPFIDWINQGHGGTSGFLRQSLSQNGSAELAHYDRSSFEPASSIGLLPIGHTLIQASNNSVNLGEKITVYTGTDAGCPTNTQPIKLTLQAVLGQVAKNASANSLDALSKRFGLPALQTTATQLQMGATQYGHTYGCKSAAIQSPSRMTLNDSHDFFRELVNGKLGSEEEELLYSVTEHPLSYPGFNGQQSIEDVIDQEAAKLNLSASTISVFKANTSIHGTVGSYDLVEQGIPRFYRNAISVLRLPYHLGGQIYISGGYAGAYVNHDMHEGNSEYSVARTVTELHRKRIGQALSTWVGYQSGMFAKFGGSCLGGNGYPQLNASGLPDIGQTLSYQLSNGVWNQATLFQIGFSQSNWGPIPLPFLLNAFGAPGCALRTPATITFVQGINQDGKAQLDLQIPFAKNLIGASFFTQCWNLDASANALGLTFTNGLQTTLGGKN